MNERTPEPSPTSEVKTRELSARKPNASTRIASKASGFIHQQKKEEEFLLQKMKRELTWLGSFRDPTLESRFRLTFFWNTHPRLTNIMIVTLLAFVGMWAVHLIIFPRPGIPLFIEIFCFMAIVGLRVAYHFDKRFKVPDMMETGSERVNLGHHNFSTWDPHTVALPMITLVFLANIVHIISLYFVIPGFEPVLTLSASTFLVACANLVCMLHATFIGLKGTVFVVSSFLQTVVFAALYYALLFGRHEEFGAEDLPIMIFFSIFDIFHLLVLTGLVAVSISTIDWGSRWSFLTRITLEKKALQVHEIQKESERLLYNILPVPIALRLMEDPTANIADSYDEVTLLFCDIPNFRECIHLQQHDGFESVHLLNTIICKIDASCELFGIEKIKTIGVVYMAMAGGLPSHRAGHHCRRMLLFALNLQRLMRDLNEELGTNFQIQIGVNVGPVVTGVIGTQKFSYDVWGDAVNVASRMESNGVRNRIQVTDKVVKVIDRAEKEAAKKGRESSAATSLFRFEKRGPIPIKGKGDMITYLLVDLHASQPIPMPPIEEEEQAPAGGHENGVDRF